MPRSERTLFVRSENQGGPETQRVRNVGHSGPLSSLFHTVCSERLLQARTVVASQGGSVWFSFRRGKPGRQTFCRPGLFFDQSVGAEPSADEFAP